MKISRTFCVFGHFSCQGQRRQFEGGKWSVRLSSEWVTATCPQFKATDAWTRPPQIGSPPSTHHPQPITFSPPTQNRSNSDLPDTVPTPRAGTQGFSAFLDNVPGRHLTWTDPGAPSATNHHRSFVDVVFLLSTSLVSETRWILGGLQTWVRVRGDEHTPTLRYWLGMGRSRPGNEGF